MSIMEKRLTLFAFAGEQSGDYHGGKILSSLKQRCPDLDVVGVGGSAMRAVGMESILDISEFQVMGFSDVFRVLPRLWKHFRMIKGEILKRNPNAVLFIDYPGFNLRMAKALRKAGYEGRLIHYICPSVWAWRQGRIKDMEAYLDLLISIFPFEEKCFEKTKLPVEYVGNPLVDAISVYSYDDRWLNDVGVGKRRDLIGIFPGSRNSEIKNNLSVQLQAAELLYKDDKSLQFCVSIARDELIPIIKKVVGNTFFREGENIFFIPKKYSYELMRDCHTAIATSGTVTVELGLHQTPTIVGYYVSPFNAFLVKYLFKLNLTHYCMVNIILEEQNFPELMHKKFTPENIYKEAKELIQETAKRHQCIDKSKKLYSLLHKKNSSALAAKAIERELICGRR